VTAPIEVAWVDLDPQPGELRSLEALLDDDERGRVARRATEVLRRRAAVSLARRRLLAARVLGTAPDRVALVVSPEGRRLATAPGGGQVALSVSTSGDTGLVAVASDHAVGVDVEDFGELPSTPAFARRVATTSEQAAIATLDGAARERALLSLWTRKEAYLKATGEGITGGLAHVEVPLDEGHWGTRWCPVGEPSWFLYDLACPRPELVAAVVVGPASEGLGSDVAPTLHVSAG
jgi:4'-phosphopantetheinyl transferase